MNIDESITATPYDFILSMEHYEGPLDVLLILCRQRKFDLMCLPITELAEQYLIFIQRARKVKLELAADYLVMASWLAWLKSRLLLPNLQQEDEEFLSAEQQVEQLQSRLRHLEAIRNSAEELKQRPRLKHDFFASGSDLSPEIYDVISYQPRLYDLLHCYGRLYSKNEPGILKVVPTDLYSPDRALKKLRGMIGHIPDWAILSKFLPKTPQDPLIIKSAYASLLCAALELTRKGLLHLNQSHHDAPIMIKRNMNKSYE